MTMTTTTNKTVSHAKPKAAAAKKPSAADKAKAAVEKMRQASLTIPAPSAPPSELVMMPLSLIETRAQVRTEFDDASLTELAQDIAVRGVLQPILLRPNPGGANYLVIAGERRLRAARLAQLEAVPAIIGEVDDDTASLMQIAENIQREDLSLGDEAAAVRRLYELCGNSLGAVAERLHKSKSWVSKRLAASCPNLNWAARSLIEDGVTEDLEIVLTVDKIAALDYYSASQVARKVRAGKAGRETVRQALEVTKQEKERQAEEARQRNEEWNSPEAVAARAAEREALERDYEARQAAARLDPINTRWRDVAKLDDEQRAALLPYLDKIREKGAAASGSEFRIFVLKSFESGGAQLELAAYLTGYTGQPLDLDALQKEIDEANDTESEE
jgi:ParB/RepB/Spo0J family partition protein